MEKAMEEARSALTRAADDMARFYDAHRREAPLYKVGDKVWLNGQNIRTTQLMKKLDHKWLRPYSVEKVISQSAIMHQFSTELCSTSDSTLIPIFKHRLPIRPWISIFHPMIIIRIGFST